MKHRILASLTAFSLFSLVGPFLRMIFPPTGSGGRFSLIIDDVVLYLWPTSVLGIGQPANWQNHVALIAANFLFFGTFGLLIGLCVSRTRVALLLYIGTCATVVLVEAWVFRSSLSLFSWCALVIVFIFYAVPFWAVKEVVKSDLTTA